MEGPRNSTALLGFAVTTHLAMTQRSVDVKNGGGIYLPMRKLDIPTFTHFTFK